ncbi:MAG: hypothetical protein CMF71_07690 [Magnetovibrio sp.]|nr:hypothetical protein [Magnetovibrio sp.]|tara:strand:- start:1020 stop:1391 length:372 start_codon:yes stop_codon:yes gene_type:complete
MNDFSQNHKPTEIRVKKEEKVLEVDFEDGASFRLPAELLRVESPSAEVQGHGPSQKKVVAGRRHVGILGVETVGNYAIAIQFDDLHDSGIYTWDCLYDFGENQEVIWQAYLDELTKKGLSRDP